MIAPVCNRFQLVVRWIGNGLSDDAVKLGRYPVIDSAVAPLGCMLLYERIYFASVVNSGGLCGCGGLHLISIDCIHILNTTVVQKVMVGSTVLLVNMT